MIAHIPRRPAYPRRLRSRKPPPSLLCPPGPRWPTHTRRSNTYQRHNLLIELGRRLAGGDPAGDVMAWLCRRLTRLLSGNHCRIVEQLPQSGDLLLRASAGLSIGVAGQTVLALAADGPAAAALRERRPVVATIVQKAASGRVAGPAFCAYVPISAPGRPYGLLVVVRARQRSFTRPDLSFLQLVADLLTGLTAQGRQLQLESHISLMRSLRQAETRAAVPGIILAHLGASPGYVGGAIILRYPAGTLAVAQGDGIWAAITGTVLVGADGVSAKVMRSGELFLMPDRTSLPSLVPELPIAEGLAAVCLPLIFYGHAIGVLWVACQVAFTHDDLQLLTSVAEVSANALYRTSLSEQAVRLVCERQQISDELRKAEHHLDRIVESASDLVISVDTSGRIVTWNRAAEQVSGHVKAQVLGRHLGDYCRLPDDCVRMGRLMSGLLLEPHQGQSDELYLVSAAGQLIPIAWRFASLENELGEVIGTVAVGRDLREQRRLQAQLFQSAKMVSMGVMASGIGHELRNPLGIISANAQLALAHADKPDLVSACLQRVCSATRRAALIIDNLLTFAQPGDAEHIALSVNDVLVATLALLDHQIKLRQIVLHTDLGLQPAVVLGNPALLQQVFTNLILNACQAMPDGGNLWLTTSLDGTGGIAIAVRDEGDGISADLIPHIFEPFFTTRPVGQGTGLGLAISYSIVQQHGGQIDVVSRPGAGSTFIVRLSVPSAASEP